MDQKASLRNVNSKMQLKKKKNTTDLQGTTILHKNVVLRSLCENFQPFCSLKQTCRLSKTFDSQRFL